MILNSLPGEAIARGLAALADYGRFLEIGKRDIYQNTRLGLQPFRKNLSFFAIDLDRVIRRAAGAPRLAAPGDRPARVATASSTPLPHRAWPIAEAVDAFRFMQQARHIGKVVLSLGEPAGRGRPRRGRAADVPRRRQLPDHGRAGRIRAGGRPVDGRPRCRHPGAAGASRGRARPRPRQAVAELERLGARVVVHAGDVAQDEDVAAVLAEIDRDLPPLRGVRARGDGPGGRPARQPRPRPDGPRAGPEGEPGPGTCTRRPSAGRSTSS